MHTHDNSPADDLKRAIDLGLEGLKRMKRRGVEESATADFGLAFGRVLIMFEKLPRLIADGKNSFCKNCEHATTETEITYGDGQASREYPACLLDDPLQCPCVNAAGFISEDDLRAQVPGFLKRQAE